MEENNEQKITSIQDVKDMFTLETTLNALLDKYDETYEMLLECNKTNSKLNEQLTQLREDNTKLTESNKELLSRVTALCDKAGMQDEMTKLRKDNVKLVKDNRSLLKQIEELKKNGVPEEEKSEETTTEAENETKPVEIEPETPVEVKMTGNKVKPHQIDDIVATPKMIEDAKMIINRFKSQRRRPTMCRKDSLKNEFKDTKYRNDLYNLLIDKGFVDKTGRIKTFDVNFD